MHKSKVILAPMVRIGTLPTRIMALKYGADLVYSEELIDYKLVKCKRTENTILGTIDFVDENGSIVFRTCEKERKNVVLQIGSNNAQRALEAAKLVEKDVCCVDLNMGCPKDFSLKGGMGAALLTQPDRVKDILTTLVQGVSIPVTCKIRILNSVAETVELAKLIESCGVVALAVHGRLKEERPKHKNKPDYIKAVAEAISIPVIANGGSGEINCYEDIEKFRLESGASSVMIARQAEHNVSIFRKEGKLPDVDVIKTYLKHAIDYGNYTTNTKYNIQQILGEQQDSPIGRKFLGAQTIEEICKLWNMKDYLDEKNKEFEIKRKALKRLRDETDDRKSEVKKVKVDDEDIYQMEAKFVRKMYSDVELPKMKLLMWTRKNNIDQPKYRTEQKSKYFRSTVFVDGKTYMNTYWEKNRKQAEQGAGLVAAVVLNLITDLDKRLTSEMNKPNPIL